MQISHLRLVLGLVVVVSASLGFIFGVAECCYGVALLAFALGGRRGLLVGWGARRAWLGWLAVLGLDRRAGWRAGRPLADLDEVLCDGADSGLFAEAGGWKGDALD